MATPPRGPVIKRSNTLCDRPFVHLYAEADGEVRPCCIAGFFATKLSIADDSIESVWNSEQMRQLRVDMLAGARNPVCSTCYEREARGEVSPRLLPVDEGASGESGEVTKRPEYDFALPAADGSMPVDIQFLDIRFSNLCNLRCRMCSHRYSSRWFEDERRMAQSEGGEPPASRVIRVSEDTVGKLIPYLGHLKSVYFAGGEPMLMPEHFQLLTWLHDNGRTKDIDVFYSTNLTALSYRGVELADLWKDFRLVKLSISCDGFGAVGEYQRTGFKHDEFFANLDRVKTFADPMFYTEASAARWPRRVGSGIIYDIQYTTTIYNVFHIFDFLEFTVGEGHVPDTDTVNLAYAWSPAVASLNNAGDKEAIVRYLEDGRSRITARKTIVELDNLIGFTKKERDIPFDQVKSWNDRLDEMRGTASPFAAGSAPSLPDERQG
jgi:MoaA/NifB/PqqE/SkfB family radical SAM enzyme